MVKKLNTHKTMELVEMTKEMVYRFREYVEKTGTNG